jgi:F-type H+-transporting ATPase subunit alpha
VERQIAIIFAGTQGLLDDMPVDQIRSFEEFLFGFLDRKHGQVLVEIANKKELTDDLRSALTSAIEAAKAEFMAAQGIKAA